METEKDSIRRMLREQLVEAIEQRKRAFLALKRITPHPDGMQHFKNASRAYSQALRNVARIIRLTAKHIVTGITLEDLKKDSGAPETENRLRALKEHGEHTD